MITVLQPGMTFTQYIDANGKRIDVDSTACKDACVTTFTTIEGKVIFILRADIAQLLQTARD